MTQISRPQADTQATYASPPHDPGPYTADQWAELFQVLFTGDQEATQGPLIRYANELVVANTTPTFTVGTGAAFCYGHWFINDALVTFNPTDADRKDLVVLVNNNTNAVYNTNLEFPVVPGVDYDAGPVGVAAYSCRLAILTGTGVGVARPLVNAAGINMIELANYEVTAAAGVITDMTDARDYCEFSTEIVTAMIADLAVTTAKINTDAVTLAKIPNRTRKFFVRGTVNGSYEQGWPMGDNSVISIQGGFMVPLDFVSGMTVTAVVIPLANGNVYSSNEAWYGTCGAAYNATNDVVVTAAVAVTNGNLNCIQPITLSAEAAGDIVSLEYIRTGDDILDTIGDTVYFNGWIVEYTADS